MRRPRVRNQDADDAAGLMCLQPSFGHKLPRPGAFLKRLQSLDAELRRRRDIVGARGEPVLEADGALRK
jgi:hypothetical protein